MSTIGTVPAQVKRFFRAPGQDPALRLFLVAFLVRLLYLTLAHTYRLRPGEDHFQFGWEMGRIARALVTGYGYADPFRGHTGPTAWVPPLYPLLMAAVFKLFGVYTLRSAWFLLALNSLFSAAVAPLVFELGLHIFGTAQRGRSIALWSGWLWALYPAALQYAVRWPWEMSLTTALFTCTLVLAFRLRAEPRSLGRWALFGLLWGLIALSNSTLLLFLPVCGAWMLLGQRNQRTFRAFAGAVLAAFLFLATIAPWSLRNQHVFHTFLPLRGNFGAEMAMGNGPGANGLLMEYNHPFQAAEQFRQYAALGEVAYVHRRGQLAAATIAHDPGLFLRNTLKRIYFFWVSVPHPVDKVWYTDFFRVLDFSFLSLAGLLGLALALRRGRPGAGLLAWAFLLLPLPYYFVTVHARFRHPLEPLITLFAVFLFQSAQLRGSQSRRIESLQP